VEISHPEIQMPHPVAENRDKDGATSSDLWMLFAALKRRSSTYKSKAPLKPKAGLNGAPNR
jgi:hypothetical protein